MKTNNIIKEGENVCENNCPDYNGMSILHLEQCGCSCHPVLAKGDVKCEPTEGKDDATEEAIALLKKHGYKITSNND